MPIISWDNSLSVKVKELDDQHRQFIETVNALHEKLLHIDSTEYKDFKKRALDLMREYALFHFSAEEKHMVQIGYPDLLNHRRIHNNFISKIQEYENSVKEGTLIFNSELMKTLVNWFNDHILKEDMKYVAFTERENL